jgi:hypothetical protein
LKAEGCQSFLKHGHIYDIDGDGQADSSADIYGACARRSPATGLWLAPCECPPGAPHHPRLRGSSSYALSARRRVADFAWSPAFVASLRSQLGPQAIILANSAGSISDSSLSGVTIEMEGCIASHGGVQMCSNALSGQHLATISASIEPVSVLWLTHSESMSPAEQCANVAALQKLYPWAQAGTDYFDGSHVVC